MKIKDWSNVVFVPLFITMGALSAYVIIQGISSGRIEYNSRFVVGRVSRNIDWFDYTIWGMMLMWSSWFIIHKIMAMTWIFRKRG